MKYEDVEKKIAEKKVGSFFQILYKTFPTISSKGKENGVTIEKVVSRSVRTGVKYSNISGVHKSENTTRKSWCHWVIENRILKHNTEDKYYVSVATNKNKHARHSVKWYINGVESTLEEVKNSGYVIPSYFNSDSADAAVLNIGTNNIIEIT